MSTSNIRSLVCIATMLCASAANAADCPGNPGAIGTARTLSVKPSEFPMVGTVQYRESLRLKDREVVLTFDDGPSAPYTGTILDVLASECIKATFFMMGSNIVDAPDLLRRAYNEGHSIGTHTFNHENLNEVSLDEAKATIDKGIAAANEALGNSGGLTPFFRPPYLEISKQAERYLLSKGQMIWSVDADSEDWNDLEEEAFVNKAISELEKRGRGILLLHDIQPVTARGLGQLIDELKKRKFKIVHVVPAKDGPVTVGALAKPASATTPR